MKKILATVLVLVLLTANLISVCAEGTKFSSMSANTLLTEDGRLFEWDGESPYLDFVDSDVVDYMGSGCYIKKDLYVDGTLVYREKQTENSSDFYKLLAGDIIQDVNGVLYHYFYEPSKHSSSDKIDNKKIISKKCQYFMTEDNSLYSNESYKRDPFSLIKDNVLDYYVFNSGNYNTSLVFRDKDYNLYGDGIKLENCSEIYSVSDSFYNFAKSNDGKWYHWGLNSGQPRPLEPERMVDGIDISPLEIKEPIQATEYIFQYPTECGKILTWALDEKLYYDGRKILDNVVGCPGSSVPYHNGPNLIFNTYKCFVNSDGDVAIYDKDINDFVVLDTNFTKNSYTDKDCFSINRVRGIDKDGNFVVASKDDNYKIHTIRAGYKYLNRSDWANTEIEYADEMGYIDSVKLFDMQSNIKREDFCNMIVDFCEKYLGKEISGTSNPFKDTENEKVIKAYANGIIAGVSSDRFAPEDRITREQMCAIMTRAAKFLKPDVQFGQGIAFSDMDLVSDWAVEGVNAMSGLGIVKGDGVSITPKSNTSVEQAIAMTYRLYNKIR